MRLARPAALLAAAGAAAATTVAVQLAGGGTASACDAPLPANTPISRDAPYDTPLVNSHSAGYPAVRPAAGQDYGHLPRWKQYADGRVLLREDRVTLRRIPNYQNVTYTNVNPRIRSYWLDEHVRITVQGNGRYFAVTGRSSRPGTFQVGRRQFLDAFNVRGNPYAHYSKYRAVYRITFDATHTRIRAIEEMPQFYSC